MVFADGLTTAKIRTTKVLMLVHARISDIIIVLLPYSGIFSHGANFRGFCGWPTTAKIRTAKVLMLVRVLTLCGAPRQVYAKVKTVKVSSGASGGVFAKVCTRESFPLYGISFLAIKFTIILAS